MKNCAFNAFEQRVMGRNAYFSLFILIYDFVLLIYILFIGSVFSSSLDFFENNILFFYLFLVIYSSNFIKIYILLIYIELF